MKDKIIGLLKIINREGMDKLISWLEKSDFFSSPASTKFHGNYEGGLAEHSFNVYTLLKEKNERYNLGLSEENLIVSALLHDVCKINFYTKEQRWRKDANNKWEEYFPYVIKEELPLGHGEKSVMLIQAFIKLERVEIFLIRFHMGATLEGQELKAYYQATEIYPSIVAIHTADYEASKFLEKMVEI